MQNQINFKINAVLTINIEMSCMHVAKINGIIWHFEIFFIIWQIK